MPNVDINGTTVSFPDDMTPDQLKAAVASAAGKIGKLTPSQPQGIMEKIGSFLDKPEQMSRQGLGQLAGMVPKSIGGPMTGNLPKDIAKGTPRVLADTLAETAPGFVSKGSILTAGAAPIIGNALKAAAPLGRSIGAGFEDWAGIKPSGTLAEAFKGNVTGFSKGIGAAKPFYQAASKELPYEETLFKGVTQPQEILDKAVSFIDKGGKLEPQEGLIVRKALDQVKKRISPDAFAYYRKTLDNIAKSNEDIAMADPIHKKGMMAESMRSLLPKNVGGRASPFKVMEALATAHMGPVGKVIASMFSPAALGAEANVLGGASRIASNPRSAIAALQALRRLQGNNENLNP